MRGMYVEMCCLQTGQFLFYLVELVRQEAQKVCPQETVVGLRKMVMQMGQMISYIYIDYKVAREAMI